MDAPPPMVAFRTGGCWQTGKIAFDRLDRVALRIQPPSVNTADGLAGYGLQTGFACQSRSELIAL
jgi:hypothetical protein